MQNCSQPLSLSHKLLPNRCVPIRLLNLPDERRLNPSGCTLPEFRSSLSPRASNSNGDRRRLGPLDAPLDAPPRENALRRAAAPPLLMPYRRASPHPPLLARFLVHAAGSPRRRRAAQEPARSSPATCFYRRSGSGRQPACRSRRVRRRYGRALLLVVLALLFLGILILLFFLVFILVMVESLLIIFILVMVESLFLIVLHLVIVIVDVVALLLDFLVAGAADGGDSRIRRHGAAPSCGYGRRARRGDAVRDPSSLCFRQRRCPVSRSAALHPAEDDCHQTPGPADFCRINHL